MNTQVDTLLLDEIKGLRTDVRDSTQAITRLAVQMETVLHTLEATEDHGQRIALLEQWKKGEEEDSSSDRAERRANLALIVSVAIAVLGWALPLLQHGHK